MNEDGGITMKKFMKSFMVLGMVLALLLTFTACGSKSNVSGKTYVFESYTLNGVDATETLTAVYASQKFEFKADGVCEQTIVWAEDLAALMGTDPVVVSGTYAEEGNTVTVTIPVEDEEDTVMTFTVDGDTLQMVEEGSTTVYRVTSES